MVYHDPKLIFIHAPKTAGTSIENVLMKLFRNRDKHFGIHAKLQQVVDIYPDINLDEYTIFTVKRNTWDRILSAYLNDYRHFLLGNTPYVPFETFYKSRLPNSILDFVSVNGSVLKNVKFLEFDNINEEFVDVMNTLGFNDIKFVHKNINTQVDLSIRKFLSHNNLFKECVLEKYSQEIEFFGYEFDLVDRYNIYK